MTVTLTPEQESLVDESVREGRYSTREEAVNAALSSLKEPEIGSLEMANRLRAVRHKSIVDVFRDPAFVGSGIDLQRDSMGWREVDFD